MAPVLLVYLGSDETAPPTESTVEAECDFGIIVLFKLELVRVLELLCMACDPGLEILKPYCGGAAVDCTCGGVDLKVENGYLGEAKAADSFTSPGSIG